MIKDVKSKCLIRGIKILSSLALTHILFVEDVVLFGIGTIEEWLAFEVILDTFCKASRLCIGLDKSRFLFNNMEVGTLHGISHSLPYNMEHISKGFKYLGYFIKPLGYEVKDWFWMVQNFERRIKHWAHKLLSLGGKLVMI